WRTISSPSGVTDTSLALRSNSLTSSSSSSFLMATDSVGCETKQASAARPKCFSRATATMYLSSVRVMPHRLSSKRGAGVARAALLPGSLVLEFDVGHGPLRVQHDDQPLVAGREAAHLGVVVDQGPPRGLLDRRVDRLARRGTEHRLDLRLRRLAHLDL